MRVGLHQTSDVVGTHLFDDVADLGRRERLQHADGLIRVHLGAPGQCDVGLARRHRREVGRERLESCTVALVEGVDGVESLGDGFREKGGLTVEVTLRMGHLAVVEDGEAQPLCSPDDTKCEVAGVAEVGGGIGGLVGDHLHHVADLAGMIVFRPDGLVRSIMRGTRPRRGVVEGTHRATDAGVDALGQRRGSGPGGGDRLRIPRAQLREGGSHQRFRSERNRVPDRASASAVVASNVRSIRLIVVRRSPMESTADRAGPIVAARARTTRLEGPSAAPTASTSAAWIAIAAARQVRAMPSTSAGSTPNSDVSE